MSVFDRIFRRAEPQPTVAEGSIVDNAQRQCNEIAGRAYMWVAQQSPWAAARIDDVVAIASEMESRGYKLHFSEFNQALIQPLMQGLPDVVRTVQATATCARDQDIRAAFGMWNVLCFWLSVAIMLLNLLNPFGSALGDLIGVGLRYLTSYTLYFVFVRVPNRRWMLIALVILGLYISSCVFGGVGGLVFLIPAVTNFATAGANGVLAFYGYQIYLSLGDGRGAADML